MSAASTGEGLTAHSEPARLIPGSPGGLRATASGWRRTAGDVRDAGARVGRLRQIDDWSGEAAQTYEARLHSIRGAWIALETALRAGAVAVEAFADALTAARATAGDAVSLWQRAEQEAAVLPSTTAFVHSSTTPMHEDARAVLAQARATVDEAARVLADALASARSDPRLGTDAWTRLMHGDLTAARAMRLLGSGGADETRALLRAQPAAVAVVADADPEAIFSWWGGLTFAQREVLITDRPDLVGNLEGVPSAIRDRANRLVLDRRLRDTRREIDRLENSSHAVPHGTQSPALEAAREQLRSLESIFLRAHPRGVGAAVHPVPHRRRTTARGRLRRRCRHRRHGDVRRPRDGNDDGGDAGLDQRGAAAGVRAGSPRPGAQSCGGRVDRLRDPAREQPGGMGSGVRGTRRSPACRRPSRLLCSSAGRSAERRRPLLRHHHRVACSRGGRCLGRLVRLGGSGPVRDHSASTVDGGGYFDSGAESIRNIARATTGQGGSVSPYVAPSPTHLQRASQEDLFYGTP